MSEWLVQLARQLTRVYGPDAAHEAVVALLARSTPPRNPETFARHVAWCYVNRRPENTRQGVRRLVALDPLVPRLSTPAIQERRFDARARLKALDPACDFLDLDLDDPRAGEWRRRKERLRQRAKRRKT